MTAAGPGRPVGRLGAVDALRGVAVTLVVLHHLPLGSLGGLPALRPLVEVQRLGFVGVSLFLVLSGFSIHLRYAGRAEPLAIRAFLWRRVRRIYPTYYVGLALAVVLALLTAGGAETFGHRSWGWTGTDMPLALFALLHAVVLPANLVPLSVLTVAWSLALEEQLYLGYALARRRVARVRPGRWLLVAVVVYLGWRLGAQLLTPSVPKSQYLPDGSHPWASTVLFSQAPARCVEWVLGLVAAEWYVTRPRPVTAGRALALVVAAAVVLTAAGLSYQHRLGPVGWAATPFYLTDIAFDALCGVGFFLLLLAALSTPRRPPDRARPPRTGGLARLGAMSFSVYLVHLPVIHAFDDALPAAPVPRAVGLAMLLAVALGASWLLHRCVERRFLSGPRDRQASASGEAASPVPQRL
jgi:peptidoglycan/LPS O-acetylase OafA/YrhL